MWGGTALSVLGATLLGAVLGLRPGPTPSVDLLPFLTAALVVGAAVLRVIRRR